MDPQTTDAPQIPLEFPEKKLKYIYFVIFPFIKLNFFSFKVILNYFKTPITHMSAKIQFSQSHIDWRTK
jgi:hypothetical protein